MPSLWLVKLEKRTARHKRHFVSLSAVGLPISFVPSLTSSIWNRVFKCQWSRPEFITALCKYVEIVAFHILDALLCKQACSATWQNYITVPRLVAFERATIRDHSHLNIYKVFPVTHSIFALAQISSPTIKVIGHMVFLLNWSILALLDVDHISGIE